MVVSEAVMTEEVLKEHSDHYIVSSAAGSQLQPVEVRSCALPAAAAV